MNKTRCEGQRRLGGAFSLGPVQWVQCNNDATVLITVEQDGETSEFAACEICYQEAEGNKYIIVKDSKRLLG